VARTTECSTSSRKGPNLVVCSSSSPSARPRRGPGGGGTGSRAQRPSSPTTSSSRSSRACRTGPSAVSGASHLPPRPPRALISHPDHRARLPQTLAGFFRVEPHQAAPHIRRRRGTASPTRPATGPALIDASFSFLPDREREHLVLLDGCSGLLLCRCHRFPGKDEFDYLVVNPATEKWVAVPVSRRWSEKVLLVCLGFEPAFSSHFHVFEFQLEKEEDDDDAGDGCVLVVKIYSSATGVWSYKQSGWSFGITPLYDSKSVFVNGVMHVAFDGLVGAVDVEDKTWRAIDFPRCEDSPFFDDAAGFIDLSQGRLHLAIGGDVVGDKLAIWVLEDGDSGEWTLKHTVSFKHLVGKEYVDLGLREFVVVAIHPDRKMVFFVFGHDKKTLMSYDMDSGKVHIIHDLGDSG
jgi:F-box interacting protein